MSHYKPYPAYKDSGVEWIGEVPEHWGVKPIKSIANTLNGATPESSKAEYWDGDIAWYTPTDIDNEFAKELGAPRRYITQAGFDSCAVKLAPAGSVVLSTRAPIGSVGITPIPSAINQGCRTLVPVGEVPAKLIASLLVAARNELRLRGNGTTFQELSTEALRSLRVPLPPPAERTSIVNRLDRETTRIDALITKKTRFIELLKEKRQALITHAVTKGLDPKAKMKDSGVEWIGQVPDGWEMRRLASMFREAIRPGDPSLPILSISIHDGITDGEVAPEDRDRRVSQIEDRTKYKRVVPNDLAYNMMRAWQGAFGAVTVDGLVSPAYVVAEPTDAFRTGFVEHLLHTPMAIEEMRRYSRGIADFRMRLYWEYFRDLKVCLPSIDEQDAILSRISRETTRIDLLSEKTQHSITLLKERRSAFITAAVTGQIDLRESA